MKNRSVCLVVMHACHSTRVAILKSGSLIKMSTMKKILSCNSLLSIWSSDQNIYIIRIAHYTDTHSVFKEIASHWYDRILSMQLIKPANTMNATFYGFQIHHIHKVKLFMFEQLRDKKQKRKEWPKKKIYEETARDVVMLLILSFDTFNVRMDMEPNSFHFGETYEIIYINFKLNC